MFTGHPLSNFVQLCPSTSVHLGTLDQGELKDKYPKHWALLADKGYQGATEKIRAILPSKGKDLSREENTRNKKIAKNRIICENFYGRMKKLFKIMEGKYKWDEDTCSTVFNVCAALTNYHIMKYPLRNEDGIYYKVVLKSYADEQLDKKRKQQDRNKKYNEKTKNRRIKFSGELMF